MFDQLIETLRANPRRIVLADGPDPRVLEAAARLTAEDLMSVILTGDEEQMKTVAAEHNFDISKCTILNPATYPQMSEMVDAMFKLRKGKMTLAQCRSALTKSNYFGTMLVKMGIADCLLGGATYSTADTVRPALQLIKTKPGHSIVSSVFILVRPCDDGSEECIAMADCAINIAPNEDELAEIAIETAETAKQFGIEPKIAFLSYSTHGSGKGPTVDLVRLACAKAQHAAPELDIDGELQFDAAVSPVVACTKCKGSHVAGEANVFIFPNIDAGNIGYKIAQRLGGFSAYGPILQGINAPINDLSRGCCADEIYRMAIITAAMH
ncbi:MAG: phosphate acetyltransferase [Oscillospiraceae bacterium]|nr:phosphate acetyltransferase [Oscillospiraceae bacterium]